MIPSEDKEAFLDLTSGNEIQKMRIRLQIRAELSRSQSSRAHAKEATAITPDAIEHLRHRLGRVRARRRHPAKSIAAVALAFAVLLSVFLLGRSRWSVPEQPVSLSSGALQMGDVALELDGLGTVGGTQQAPVIQWQSGKIEVDVTPNRGVNLAIVTPEAIIKVVGTAFSVDRTHFVTRVNVSHGTVEVTCTGQTPARVTAQEERVCLPADAATWLRRVSALRRSGAPLEQRREAVDAGLVLGVPGSELHTELLAQRADILSSLGADEEALTAVRAYRSIGGPRDNEMSALEERIVRRMQLKDGADR